MSNIGGKKSRYNQNMDYHTYYYVKWERMNDIILNTWIWGNKYVIKFFEHIF